jgi:hypothetical protein
MPMDELHGHIAANGLTHQRHPADIKFISKIMQPH